AVDRVRGREQLARRLAPQHVAARGRLQKVGGVGLAALELPRAERAGEIGQPRGEKGFEPRGIDGERAGDVLGPGKRGLAIDRRHEVPRRVFGASRSFRSYRTNSARSCQSVSIVAASPDVACCALSQAKSDLYDFGRLRMPNSSKPSPARGAMRCLAWRAPIASHGRIPTTRIIAPPLPVAVVARGGAAAGPLQPLPSDKGRGKAPKMLRPPRSTLRERAREAGPEPTGRRYGVGRHRREIPARRQPARLGGAGIDGQ